MRAREANVPRFALSKLYRVSPRTQCQTAFRDKRFDDRRKAVSTATQNLTLQSGPRKSAIPGSWAADPPKKVDPRSFQVDATAFTSSSFSTVSSAACGNTLRFSCGRVSNPANALLYPKHRVEREYDGHCHAKHQNGNQPIAQGLAACQETYLLTATVVPLYSASNTIPKLPRPRT